ncbi:MAG: single-stranded-DNA-specific exonuclease RecJ [Candidatus Promineifilaceae bacterium]
MSRPKSLRTNHWQIAPPARFEEPEKLDHYHPVLLQVLYNRGLTRAGEITSFLTRQYHKDRDPFQLADMDKAIERIQQAVDRDETIVVYGDFDADGVTATVLLVEALRGLGLHKQQVVPYIPDRVDEGYGLNFEALEAIRGRGASLVISVDCGIRSRNEVRLAEDIGLDMIITDHHSLGAELPPAKAVINPKRSDSSYPEEMLAGVGISFKLAQAIHTAFPDRAAFDEVKLLDLVALGTVADLVPLIGENRVLVAGGLEVLNRCKRPGIEALVEVSGLKPGNITSESIAFGLGPRINAAGRLSHAYDAARLLAASERQAAQQYAKELNRLNRVRQQITIQLYEKAKELINPEDMVMFAADTDFVAGVVGLVASRLADQYYRPAIVVEQGPEESRGSCRSIPGFHITEALDGVEDLLERHGGHAQAAGFTIRNENLEEFQIRINEYASSKLDEQDLKPSIPIDADVNLADVDWALHDVLAELEPTGNANARPIFVSRNVHVFSHRAVGQDGAHLQLWVGDSQTKHGCIAFRQGAWDATLPEQIDLVYTLGVNEWNGRRDLQLVVQDIQEASPQS